MPSRLQVSTAFPYWATGPTGKIQRVGAPFWLLARSSSIIIPAKYSSMVGISGNRSTPMRARRLSCSTGSAKICASVIGQHILALTAKAYRISCRSPGNALEIAATSSLNSQSSETAASARAWVIAFLLLASMALNFIDRLVLANVAPVLQSNLHLSNTQYSYIVFAFMAGMTLGQLPAGMMIDWIGARIGLSAILTGWSVCNMLHALARGVAAFSGLRFVMGLFECGNYSSSVKVIGGLFPARQTALALAIMDSGSLVGSIVAPPLVVLILTHWGWRAAFLLPSTLGFFWLYPWLKLYRVRAPSGGPTSTQRGPSTGTLLKFRK